MESFLGMQIDKSSDNRFHIVIFFPVYFPYADRTSLCNTQVTKQKEQLYGYPSSGRLKVKEENLADESIRY